MRMHNPFYDSPEWRRTRKEILEADKYECQECKKKGKYNRATHVHHVNHIDKHPELALCKFYKDDDGAKRNLISVCHDCHEMLHKHRAKEKTEPLTPERW